jgi:hypothetical protein
MRSFKVVVYINSNDESISKRNLENIIRDALDDGLDDELENISLMTVEETETDHDDS